MANVIKIKRSASASDAPTAGQLEYGELAINYNDGKLYYKNSSDAIAEIGGSGEINVQSDWNESSSSEDDFIKNKPTIAYTSAISEGNSGLVPSAGSSGQFLQYNGSWATPSYTTNTDTQLTTEQVQDIVGGMFTSNTETRISATYQDGDGTIDLVVDDMNDDTPAGYNNSNWDTAYGWGDHGLSAQDKTDIGNLSGTNTGDQTLPTRTSLGISTADHVVFNKITVGDDDGIAWSDGSYMKKAGSGDIEIASAGGDLDITTWLRMRASSNGTITGAWHHSAYKMRIGGDVTQTDYNLKIDATPLTAGSLYTAGKITTASHGDSSQWNSAYGWGNHASGGYASNSGNATTSYVDTAIANLVSDAPATLDTLGEIADALNDSNVNVWTAGLNLKANIASPTFTGTVTAPQIDIGSSGAITLNGSTGDPASDGVYGLESNDGYFDTVNSGHDSDALELVYRRGSEVRVGTGANGSKALKAGSLYDGGNRVATQTWVSAQSYGSSNLALGATSSTAYRGDRGTTAYDHSQASHAPSNANLGATVAQGTTADNALARAGGTMTGALHMHQGAYEGLITFGSNATWRCGIRQHDDADAELRIWARSSNGMIFLATGYDGEPASVSRPTDGLVVEQNNVGIGNFSSANPAYKLDVKGTIGSTGVITASGGNSGNWNTAYGWGNHASAGYGTSSLALGSTSSTAYRGDRGTTAYDHSQVAHAPSNAITGLNIGQVTSGTVSTSNIHYYMSENALESSSGSQSALQVYQDDASHDAFMTFHVGGDFACYFGLAGDNNKLSVGGWSMGSNKYAIYHEGNKPSLSELGFSGASNANYITNNNQLTNGAGYITSQTDAQTLSISGHTITISGSSSSVVVPDNNTTYSNSDWTITSLSGFNSSTANFLRGDGTWVTPPDTDTNTTYSVGDGGLSEINFTSADHTKLNGIATGATNTSAPHYTSAITSSDVTTALGHGVYSPGTSLSIAGTANTLFQVNANQGTDRTVQYKFWDNDWNGGTNPYTWGWNWLWGASTHRASIAYDMYGIEEFVFSSHYGDMVFNASVNAGGSHPHQPTERMRIKADDGAIDMLHHVGIKQAHNDSYPLIVNGHIYANSTGNVYAEGDCLIYDGSNWRTALHDGDTTRGADITSANTCNSPNNTNASTLSGLAVHTQHRSNQANKICRTDDNGYAQFGWINTTSGDNGSGTPDRIYASNDSYLRYYSKAVMQMFMGGTYKYTTSRREHTTDQNYWVGSMGWGTNTMSTIRNWGSGFFDTWDSGGSTVSDAPSTGHWQGMQAHHYTSATNDSYCFQIICKVGNPADLFVGGQWATTIHGWHKLWNAGNDGSGSGLDADLLDGQQGSYYYPASNPNSYNNYSPSCPNSTTPSFTRIASGTGDDGSYVLKTSGDEYHAGNNNYLYHTNVNANGTFNQTGTSNLATVNVSGNLYVNSSGGVHFDGVEATPDGDMHITDDCILFGGNNSGKETNSAQISAGKHISNKLNIIGMSSNTSSSNRSIYCWAEAGMGLSGTFTASEDIVAFSDVRLKENIHTIDSALDKVVKMRGVTYDRKDTGRHSAGVLADELMDIAPELVYEGLESHAGSNDTATDQYKGVTYGNITAYLIEAIKELKNEIEELKN